MCTLSTSVGLFFFLPQNSMTVSTTICGYLWKFGSHWSQISDLRPRKSKCKQVKCINCDLQRMSELAVVSFVACDGLRGRGATWKRGELRKNPLSYIISGSVGGWY